MRATKPRTWRQQVISYSDDDRTTSRVGAPRALDDSYVDGPAPGLEGSQSSLNKRLASVAGLDDTEPTDFKFLFEARGPSCKVPTGAAGAEGIEAQADGMSKPGTADAPPIIEDGEYRWIRTSIRRGSDLVDGQAWITEFRKRSAAEAGANAAADRQPEQRASRQTASPADLAVRNRVLKDMAKVSPPGRKVRLSTGDDVIFWFNVGAPGAPRSRVHVTEARCPHQGVCLLSGELREIEDGMGISSASVRCPRHNKMFDLCTGVSHGNAEVLRTFPCRFMQGCWYVGQDLGDSYGEQFVRGTPNTCALAEEVSSGQKLSWPRAGSAQDRRDPARKKLRLLDPNVFPDSAAVGCAVPNSSRLG